METKQELIRDRCGHVRIGRSLISRLIYNQGAKSRLRQESSVRQQLPARMTRRTAVQIGLAALGSAGPRLQGSSLLPAVEVGPDGPVGDLRTIQIEPYIAAHPSKPGSLIVSGAEAIPGKFGVHVEGLTQGGLQATAYASADGGRTWLATDLNPSGDPPVSVNNWVTYGGDGTAYYSTTESPVAGASYIGVYRSINEGRSWGGHVRAPGDGYDQPRIVAGTGSNATTVYIAAAYGGIGVLRSVDSRASFELVSRISPSNLGNQPREPLILADNSLLIPYADFPTRASQALTESRIYPRDYGAWFAASTDGGETFTPPRAVSRAVSRPNHPELEKLDYLKTRYRGGDYVGLAAASDSVFHAAWADARDGLFRIFHAPIRVVPV
jgi:hypothetical protein